VAYVTNTDEEYLYWIKGWPDGHDGQLVYEKFWADGHEELDRWVRFYRHGNIERQVNRDFILSFGLVEDDKVVNS